MLFALPLLLAAPPTAAFKPVELADGQCLAAFGLVANSKDQQLVQAGTLGSIYFYGKLVGRNPSVDVASLLRSVGPGVTKDPSPQLKRCGDELAKSGDALTAVSKTLAADGL